MSFLNSPEFPKDLIWFNTEPLSLHELRGRPVLIDFWTYSCINCQRTLPYLFKWWEKYKKSGLVIIGVHAPEFGFEKEQKNVQEVLEKYKITWPVVLDNDYQIWKSYANHSWPAKYLINKDGKIVYYHFGEGNYLETEREIQNALTDAGAKLSSTEENEDSSATLNINQTPELYFGSKRGLVTNLKKKEETEPNQIYSLGDWRQDEEYLEHARQTKELEDLVILSYQSVAVYLVMESGSKKEIKVYVTLDALGLTKENAGTDIKFDKKGRSFVEVRFPTLYNLVKTKTFGDHTLRISTLDQGLRLFAFTFGS